MDTDEIVKRLVKPLVWSEYETDEGTRGITVSTSCGRYLCVPSGWFLVGQSGWMEESTIAAAQAAAEADYRARIAAALNLEPVAKLVAALEGIADPKKVPSHGDPVVLRDHARAACTAFRVQP